MQHGAHGEPGEAHAEVADELPPMDASALWPHDGSPPRSHTEILLGDLNGRKRSVRETANGLGRWRAVVLDLSNTLNRKASFEAID